MVNVKTHARKTRKGKATQVRAHLRSDPTKTEVSKVNKLKSTPFIRVGEGGGSATFDFRGNEISLDGFGWSWDGTIKQDLPMGFFRGMASTLKEPLLKEFESEMSWVVFKQYFKNAMKHDSGLYAMSGDNAVWRFGESFVDSLWEEHLNDLEEQGYSRDDANDIVSDASLNAKLSDFDAFEKEHDTDFKKEVALLLDKSASFDDFADRLPELKDNLMQDLMEWQSNNFMGAVNEELAKRKKVKK